MVGTFGLRADFTRFALKMREYRSGRWPSLLRSLVETCKHVSYFTHFAESPPSLQTVRAISPLLLISPSCYTEFMQEDDKSQDWQQPTSATSGAPYESVAVDDAPVEPTEIASPETPLDDSRAQDDQVAEGGEAVIQWQATEYVQHARGAMWFLVLASITLALMAIAIFLMQSVSFAILVPVMAAALVIYVRRPPGVIDYVVSRKGIHINDKLHTYEEFRSFGVMSHDDLHSVVLVPRKRFQLSQTMYFPEDVGESLVDMLAARIPMEEVKPDTIDRILARLRL